MQKTFSGKNAKELGVWKDLSNMVSRQTIFSPPAWSLPTQSRWRGIQLSRSNFITSDKNKPPTDCVSLVVRQLFSICMLFKLRQTKFSRFVYPLWNSVSNIRHHRSKVKKAGFITQKARRKRASFLSVELNSKPACNVTHSNKPPWAAELLIR